VGLRPLSVRDVDEKNFHDCPFHELPYWRCLRWRHFELCRVFLGGCYFSLVVDRMFENTPLPALVRSCVGAGAKTIPRDKSMQGFASRHKHPSVVAARHPQATSPPGTAPKRNGSTIAFCSLPRQRQQLRLVRSSVYLTGHPTEETKKRMVDLLAPSRVDVVPSSSAWSRHPSLRRRRRRRRRAGRAKVTGGEHGGLPGRAEGRTRRSWTRRWQRRQ